MNPLDIFSEIENISNAEIVVPSVHLSGEQQDAIDYVVTQIHSGAKLVALSGPAGSGKTTLIKELIKRFDQVIVAAMTNKAAFVLRTKGIPDAVTMHQASMKPKFKPPMDRLGEFFDQVPEFDEAEVSADGKRDYYIQYPWTLKQEFGQEKLKEAYDAAQTSGVYSGFRILGIKDIFKYIESWQPREYAPGVLIIDEASMLGDIDLKTVQNVFDQVILIGDENQLPPVQGEPIFWQVENRVSLQHIHRQAEGSQPLQIATALRTGGRVSVDPLENVNVELSRKGYPVIVWKNKTRVTVTERIRERLGYAGMQPQVGEVLICRNAQDKVGKARGLINNSLWRVVEASKNRLDLVNDQGEVVKHVHVDMEEVEGGFGIPFRFAYALTAHSSQGSQWNEVMIHQPDAAEYSARYAAESRKWLYTAATRAAEKVHWVTGAVA
jgi:exodeoxyribonuclease V